MPTITIEDDRGRRRYDSFEQFLKAEVHLCDSCVGECISKCPATADSVTHGEGVGNDNIVKCVYFKDVSR